MRTTQPLRRKHPSPNRFPNNLHSPGLVARPGNNDDIFALARCCETRTVISRPSSNLPTVSKNPDVFNRPRPTAAVGDSLSEFEQQRNLYTNQLINRHRSRIRKFSMLKCPNRTKMHSHDPTIHQTDFKHIQIHARCHLPCAVTKPYAMGR